MSSANRSANGIIDANTGKIIGGSIEKIKKMDNIEMYFNQVDETFELYPFHSIGGANGGFTGPSIGTIYIKNVKPKEIIKDLTADDISVNESIYDTDDETVSTRSDKSDNLVIGSLGRQAGEDAERQVKMIEQGYPLVL